MSNQLETDGLSVSLGHNRVLRDVALRIRHGRFVGLVGPNGSGKTTLLRTLAGLLPYEGRVQLEGRELGDWPRRDLARRVAFVRQFQALPFAFTVEELVLLGRSPHKKWMEGYAADDFRQAYVALEALDVGEYRSRSVQHLSGGELQRVLLAQALVQGADILLLDEPTAHLDIHHQFSFLESVRSQFAGRGTVISVFHDLEMGARFADELIVLREGRLEASGEPAQVLSPALLESVFRMKAAVGTTQDGHLNIHYLSRASANHTPAA